MSKPFSVRFSHNVDLLIQRAAGGFLSKPFSVRFSHNVDLLIQRAAESLGISFSEWVRRAFEEAEANA